MQQTIFQSSSPVSIRYLTFEFTRRVHRNDVLFLWKCLFISTCLTCCGLKNEDGLPLSRFALYLVEMYIFLYIYIRSVRFIIAFKIDEHIKNWRVCIYEIDKHPLAVALVPYI